MKSNGAKLAVHALETLGVTHTFGIPGTHTTELYDALEDSTITPVLVTHEGGAAFMADAVSRTSDHIGVITIVPAAGLTHAMSGIGEAFLDGIPMLVIAGGTHTASGRHYQLHGLDQLELARPITKAQFRVLEHADIIPTLYKAHAIAVSGEPGPVLVELPVNLQMFTAEVPALPDWVKPEPAPAPDPHQIRAVAELLRESRAPMLFVGWGAVDCGAELVALAELLAAPVSTTLQGKSAFPNSHPLSNGVGIGAIAKPGGRQALARHDLLLTIGARFGEIATGSYGLDAPKNLVHVDINPAVFNRNFPTRIAVTADARAFVRALLQELRTTHYQSGRDWQALGNEQQAANARYLAEWFTPERDDIVSPGHFFRALQARMQPDAQLVVDDGHHTFLASELFAVERPRSFISPTDFNCMGYAVPAAIGARLANPERQVVAIVGDGAFLMTCMEITTAVTHGLGIVYCVFNDGELGQIAQFQRIPLNRATCSVLGSVNFAGVAQATGAAYLRIDNDRQLATSLDAAFATAAEGLPVIVDIHIDYSRKTLLTKGAVKTNLGRFPLREKLRFIGRALRRRLPI